MCGGSEVTDTDDLEGEGQACTHDKNAQLIYTHSSLSTWTCWITEVWSLRAVHGQTQAVPEG